MSTVKIYRYRRPYDIIKDDSSVSQRMGTREFIERVQGTVIEGTELDVDSSNIDSEGKTEIDFALTK
jgi:hypothetical protein